MGRVGRPGRRGFQGFVIMSPHFVHISLPCGSATSNSGFNVPWTGCPPAEFLLEHRGQSLPSTFSDIFFIFLLLGNFPLKLASLLASCLIQL